jgi:IclR family pca regulon transcriptional regulator
MEKNIEENKKKSKSSLIRGLMALESFTAERESFTLAEFSKLLDIPKSSLYRILKELSDLDYLRYEEQSKRYYLGMGVLSLGFSVLQGMELREIARPYLEKLSRQCNKTVNLALLDKNEMVYIERVRVPSLRDHNLFVSSVGNRIPVWNTAVGKAVLAHLEPEKFQAILGKIKESPEFKVSNKSLTKSLVAVKKNGFAINDQEFLKGIRAIAVPLFSPTGVNSAINIVVEAEEISVDALKKKYALKLIKVGSDLSKALGYRE